MPGPRAKGKAGSKPKRRSAPQLAPSGVTTDAYVNDVDNADGWNVVVDILCAHFKLPGEQRVRELRVAGLRQNIVSDLTTRSGLKRIHARFSEIFKKLDNAYTANLGNEKIMGGIVGIWAKMSADALLRDKLFRAGTVAKGFLVGRYGA